MILPISLKEVSPGDAIMLSDITELPAFEDVVAEAINPDMTILQREAWIGRIPLKDLLRPPMFNGTIADIKLLVMDEPYKRLLDAKDRGWSFSRKGGLGFTELQTTKDQAALESYQAYTFLANAKSSGKGVIGQIQAEFWYRKASSGASLQQHGGRSIYRQVTKPRLDKEKFIAIDAKAKQVGFEVLRRQMMHPIVQPIRN